MQHRSKKTSSSSQLPITYTGNENKPLVEAAVQELHKHEADLHYLRINVTLAFVRARQSRFSQLSFDLGQALTADRSGYRLLNYFVKYKSTNTYQITFLCRYVGIQDLAYDTHEKSGLIKRILRLAG